ncbi:CPBP family intramembrane metalloprotease [Pseudooceanicola sp. CBS1P-1]|uniref:CPBP family intramembrane metalloprotease n=1 Tax=Pseudooceanicola albus TaxID=2692189 RepID=A0A6L7G2S7_9RHOB|nr:MULTISPECIES: CPBP family intramembrane glutamic endopeptidase [Pseudooceanicola]MBT9385033.1 CPBP family intramembrane metalloprotease [Pseudooceanicola endophyticus]MXN18674.1 CPBP family intramembrane metalloprotease [Pseudooceanicola albus]
MSDTLPGPRLRGALLTLAGWIAITLLSGHVLHPEQQSLQDLATGDIAWQVLAAGLFLIVVLRARGWRNLRLGWPERGTLRLLWLPALMLGLLFGGALLLGLPAPAMMGLLLVNALLIGFSEEVMFRGVLFRGLRSRLRAWPAILLTSGGFGAVHVLNGLVTGDFVASAVQACNAAGTGLLLMALMLRTGSLWVAILYHALWDWVTFLVALAAQARMSQTEVQQMASQGIGLSQALMPLVLVLPGVFYALFLLRRGRAAL